MAGKVGGVHAWLCKWGSTFWLQGLSWQGSALSHHWGASGKGLWRGCGALHAVAHQGVGIE